MPYRRRRLRHTFARSDRRETQSYRLLYCLLSRRERVESRLSMRSTSFASVAQLVEHPTDTRAVVGSTPTACTGDKDKSHSQSGFYLWSRMLRGKLCLPLAPEPERKPPKAVFVLSCFEKMFALYCSAYPVPFENSYVVLE